MSYYCVQWDQKTIHRTIAVRDKGLVAEFGTCGLLIRQNAKLRIHP